MLGDFDEAIGWTDPEAFAWSEDGKALYFHAAQKLTSQLFALDVASGQAKPLTSGDRVHERVSYSKDARVIACTIEDGTSTPEVHSMRLAEGKPLKLTTTNEHLADRQLG